VIKSIDFASYGNPSGDCGYYQKGSDCHSPQSLAVIESACLGKASCTLAISDELFGSVCEGDNAQKMVVQATCTEASAFHLRATIPVNSQAEIHVPKLGLSNVVITENTKVVWQNNMYVPGDAGIISGRDANTEVVFMTGSGTYEFTTTGAASEVSCFLLKEGTVGQLSCADKEAVISMVKFASFGNPFGTCDSQIGYGSCHAGSSVHVIENTCLHKNSCAISVDDFTFGDVCGSIDERQLAVELVCSK
jgi:hypothetical protein